MCVAAAAADSKIDFVDGNLKILIQDELDQPVLKRTKEGERHPFVLQRW